MNLNSNCHILGHWNFLVYLAFSALFIHIDIQRIIYSDLKQVYDLLRTIDLIFVYHLFLLILFLRVPQLLLVLNYTPIAVYF